MKLPGNVPGAAVAAVLGVMAVGALGLWVWSKGGVKGAAKAAGGAAVDAAGGAVTGVVDGVSGAVGLPSTDDTTTDAAVARWIIDQHGYFTASKWAGVPALVKAATMAAGSGVPPKPGTAAYAALVKPAASYGGSTTWDPNAGGGSVGWW